MSKIRSSFRDPSGFLFFHNNILYRQINQVYKKEFDYFIQSGLYDELVQKDLIITHEEAEVESPQPDK